MQDLLNWISTNKEIVPLLSPMIALFVGFLSIFLTYVTIRMNRKHQRLSVKPLADISAHDFENNISVTLDNKGNGPLIIRAFRVYKGSEYKSNLIDWMPSLPKGMYWSNFQKNFEGSPLRPSESLTLVGLKLDMHNKKQCKVRDDVRRALSQLDVELDYEDIYNTPMHIQRQSLSWFARNL